MLLEKVKPHFVFDEQRIEQLKQIAPECFADGKINWEVLNEALGHYKEDDTNIEHFGLAWPGKKAARRLASIPSRGTLVPVSGEGVDVNHTQNVFIEGENLEVLKLLQKSYAGKIKMIYIDPPYNTGNDFVYDDNFTEAIDEYLKRTGQIDEEGKKLTTNSKADGRFHSKWLSMMLPRLRLARNLLKDNGLVFVSIDDNEVHNLRAIMNETFGEENFVECIIWKKRYGGGAKEKYLVSLHEYVLVYAKDKEAVNPIFIPNKQEAIDRYYKSKDKNFEKRGGYRTHPLEATKSMGERKNLIYPIPSPDGEEIWPKRQWLWKKERTLAALEKGEIEFIKDKNGSWSVHTKQYLYDEEGNIRQSKPFSVIDNVFTQHGTNEILDLFGNAQVFSFPKPTNFLKQLLNIGLENDDEIVLDFFAGSGSICQAIFELNMERGTSNSFICVQIPEEIEEGTEAYKLNFRKISDITKERIRKVSKHNKHIDKEQQDFGFKVFELKSSNYRIWENVENDMDKLESQFEMFKNPLVDNWTVESLLTEIILIEGFPLDTKIEQIEDYLLNTIVLASSGFCEHRLMICLDKVIAAETVNSLKVEENDIFICLDTAISDEQKVVLSDKGLIKTI